MAQYFLNEHFITVLLLVGFVLKLRTQKSVGDAQIKYFWLTAISTAVLVAQDCFEVWGQSSTDLIPIRLTASVIGYCFRPLAALCIVMVIYPKYQRPKFLWIPAAVNAVIYCTAFFSPIAFSFTADNRFQRGPLGYAVFIVSFFYILCFLFLAGRRYREQGKTGERIILYVCAFGCVIAALIDFSTDGSHINAAIMISCIFLYMFLRSIDTNRDPLTKLMNRQSLYRDIQQYDAEITAGALVDMNGLKKLNDEYGHDAGDRALEDLGRCLEQVSDRNTTGYRVGGDEFILIFRNMEESEIRGKLELLRTITRENGLSIAIGFAMRENRGTPITEMMRAADRKRVEEKTLYYGQDRHDRRRRASDMEEGEGQL